jgi:hypothetical protein
LTRNPCFDDLSADEGFEFNGTVAGTRKPGKLFMKRAVLSLVVVVILVGCQSVEITDYVVFEYESLKAQVADGSPGLASYRVKGAVLTPFLAHHGHDAPSVRLLFWGTDVVLTVKSVLIRSGADAVFDVDRVVDTAGLAVSAGGQKEIVLVESVPNSAFGVASEELSLLLKIEDGGMPYTLEYPIERRVRKYAVQR